MTTYCFWKVLSHSVSPRLFECIKCCSKCAKTCKDCLWTGKCKLRLSETEYFMLRIRLSSFDSIAEALEYLQSLREKNGTKVLSHKSK
jgi:hypothetical protein